jgi:hypothetical protein
VAVAETVLHDELPNHRGEFEIAAQEFEDRYLVRFAGEELVLANLTGATLKRLAGDGSMSTVMPYAMPQARADLLRSVSELEENFRRPVNP